MKHRFARLAAAGMGIALIVSLLSVATAGASPVDDKRAQATKLQRDIEANGEKISMFAEHYDEAKLRLDDATTNIAHVEDRVASAQAETERIRGIVGKRVIAMYVDAGAETPLSLIDMSSLNEAGTRARYASSTADRDLLLLQRLAGAREDLRSTQTQLEKARKRAQDEIDAIDARQNDVEAANAKQAQLLAQVNGEIATLIQQDQARKAAAEKAQSDARLAQLRAAAPRPAPDTSSATTGPSPAPAVGLVGPAVPNTPAPSGGAAAAVAYANAQLGKPYRYAGVGPDSYDCSGLTMMAWAQSGVSMPHGSIAQGNMFPRVPDNAMQPGDLVIYYPDHHHVGMYVGGGMTVSATHTGDFVKLQPVFREGFQYAVRPG